MCVCVCVVLVVWASVADVFYCKKCVGSRPKTAEAKRHLFRWHLNVHLKNADLLETVALGMVSKGRILKYHIHT